MTVEKTTNYGTINVSEEAIASLVGSLITECYGVVGMASKQVLRDGWTELLKKENYSRGVVVRKSDDGLELICTSLSASVSEFPKLSRKRRRRSNTCLKNPLICRLPLSTYSCRVSALSSNIKELSHGKD